MNLLSKSKIAFFTIKYPKPICYCTMFTHFTVLGERCSGTHFLAHAVYHNFKVSYNQGQKHFFGHEPQNPNQITLCIVRECVSWIDSFFRTPHHVPPINKTSLRAFMTNEWYSVHDIPVEKKGQEVMEDRSWLTGERYRNILEMRRQKLAYFETELPKQTSHFMIIGYEDLRDNYDDVLQQIQARFGFVRRNPDQPFVRIEKYKGTYHHKFEPKEIKHKQEIEDLIRDMGNGTHD